ncbi:MAG: hypothetical protein KAI97_04755 [Gemmatimonadetes bacterium]|nr:hypothetical protein [Gemmatimonadota bacterium]
MIRPYIAFLVLTLLWLGAAVVIYGNAYAYTVTSAIVWWALLVMLIATAYYIIQDAPAAQVIDWLRRDLIVNATIFLVLLFVILDASAGFRITNVRTAGWTGFAAAALHPIVVDWPHRKQHQEGLAGSPVPKYVPDACLAIDWTLAGLVLVALLVL